MLMPMGKITRDDKLTLLFYLLNRQTGAIADCLRHIQSGKQNTSYSIQEVNGWVAHAQSEFADTLLIVKKFCDVLGLDYDSTLVMGFVRDAEKKEEYLRKHPEATWV